MKTPILNIDEEAAVEERLTDNVINNILPARYLRKDSEGNIVETPEELFERVAENVAQAEDVFDGGWSVHDAEAKFEKAIKELRLMPNSPTLFNAGTDLNQLSACFVQEPQDDMEDIFGTAQNAAMIFQSGGGVGYPFHHLRPKGAFINSTGGYSSGPVSFMRVFDETCNQVEQGGKRRGAQMGILRVDHPDVGRFATAKREEGDLDNFNISVGVTDDFIAALEAGDDYTLLDPTTDYEEAYTATEETVDYYSYEYRENPKNAFDPREGKTVESNLWRDDSEGITAPLNDTEVTLAEKWAGEISIEEGEPLELPAEFIWDIMIDGAHLNGEPGVFYYDWSQEDHSFPVGSEYDIEATNPCAEQPLAEHEACNLMHVNLSLMLEEETPTWDEYREDHYNQYDEMIEGYVEHALDNKQFDETVVTGTRFLENVVTQSDFPLEEITEKVSEMRKIGLGVMGMAQMLYQMGVPYDSSTGRDICAEVMRRIQRLSSETSRTIAKERGTFDAWEESKWSNPMDHPDWFKRHTGGMDAADWEDGYPIRNHNTTTIAPTGTTSMIGDTSGGCEPVYSVSYYKNVGDDIQGSDFLVEFDSYFIRTLKANDIDVEAVKAEAESQMEADEFDGVSGLHTVPDEFGDVFVTTEQIDAEDHALMQRRLQSHIDSGISKTINMPNDASLNDVREAYKLSLSRQAPGMPAKGVTVYRDGSRDEQVKSTTADMDEAGEGTESPDPIELYQSDEWSDEDVEKFLDEADVDIESPEKDQESVNA